ncbi:MAG: DUF6580 family putative transport protein [bacterium]
MNQTFKLGLALFLVLGAVLLRFLPHPANFAPIAALALFSGVYLNKKYALVVPVAAMLVSDFFIGFYDWRLMSVVYSCFLISGLVGLWFKNHKNLATIIGGTLVSSLVFFLATNLAVWAFSSWYHHNWQGLLYCYSLALPFFRNTMFGDLFYVGVLFGLYEMVLILAKRQILARKTI